MIRDIEELRAIAIEMGKPLDKLLYEMLTDAMNENQKLNKYKSIVDNFINYIDKNRLVLNNPALLDFYQAIKEVK